MGDTRLKLLASDGQITVAFEPMLTTEQYAELLTICADNLLSRQDFCDLLREAAERWEVTFSADWPCGGMA